MTDHYSLLWLNNLKNPSGHLARWNTALSRCDIKFVHHKGSEHKVPDTLSRAFEYLSEIATLAPSSIDAWNQKRLAGTTRPEKVPALARSRQHDLLLSTRSHYRPNLDAWKLVLPTVERERALFEAHNTLQAGHLGIEKTFERLASYYYWPGFYYNTTCYVRTC